MDQTKAEAELGTWAGVNKYIAKRARLALQVKKPVVAEKVIVKKVEEVKEELDFEAMSKTELDNYGENVGVKLDRRKSKEYMIKELKTYLKK